MTGLGFALEEWQIRLVLPHRPPILQLDRVERCAPTLDSLQAIKAVSGSDMMLHRTRVADASATMAPASLAPASLAPANLAPANLAPGALIEALAQCCGLMLRLRWLAAEGADLAAFAAGDVGQLGARIIPRSVLAESHARFARPSPSAQMLRLATRLVLSRGDIHRFTASVQGTEDVLSADIILKFPYLA